MSRVFELVNKSTGDVTFAGGEVSRSRRCPICGHGSWCLRDAVRGLTICPRTPGEKQIGDAGYLFADNPGNVTRLHAAFISKPKPTPTLDFSRDAARYAACNPLHVADLAENLGVSEQSLSRLGCGWAEHHGAWSFPMSDARNRIIGLRLRQPDGFKYAVNGSRNALFVPEGLTGDGPLCIEEGPTSTAAVLDWDFDCIGRPSCSSCVEMTLEWIMDHGGGSKRHVVVIRNRDEAKSRPNGSVFYPGQEGGAKLADRLAGNVRTVKVLDPLMGKDSRDWKAAGATRQSVLDAIAYIGFWQGRAA